MRSISVCVHRSRDTCSDLSCSTRGFMSGTSAPHQYEASGQCLLSFASHPSPGRDVSSGGHIESARLIWESCEDIFWTSPAIMFHNAYVYMRAETTKIFFLFSLRTLGMHNWILKNDLAIILTNITIVIWFMINNFHNTILISTGKNHDYVTFVV